MHLTIGTVDKLWINPCIRRNMGSTGCESTHRRWCRNLMIQLIPFSRRSAALPFERLPHGFTPASFTALNARFPGPVRVCVSSVQQRGRERKGQPEIIQRFRLRKWPISSADFPMTPMERAEHHFGPFWEKDLGAISGGPFFSWPLNFTAECFATSALG